MRLTRNISLLCAVAFAASACGAPFPSAPAIEPTARQEPSPEQILAKSVAASGGDPYQSLSDIAVSYRGDWGTIVQALQPALTDADYRHTSEERLLLGPRVVAQVHRGQGGVKSVLRDSTGVVVAYDGHVSTDRDVLETSALVADAYSMFLLGPAWLERNGTEWMRLEDGSVGSRKYDRLLGRLRPGVGLSREDSVVAWFDRETFLLYRVHFTLEGHRNTKGAHADVTFSDYRRMHGRLWPTHFIERVRGPVDIHAHEWIMEGLDVDRGLTLHDLGAPGATAWSKAAAQPAARVPSVREASETEG